MSAQAIWQTLVSVALAAALIFLWVIWGIVRELEPLDPTDPVDEATLFTGGCFKVKSNPPPTAHAEVDNRFCITENNGFWALVPGEGMEEWQSVAGPKEIPLLNPRNDPGVFVAYFDFEVVGHPPKPPSSHGPRHENPDYQFMVQVNPGPKTKVVIRPRRVTSNGGPPVHGGSAHAEN